MRAITKPYQFARIRQTRLLLFIIFIKYILGLQDVGKALRKKCKIDDHLSFCILKILKHFSKNSPEYAN